MIAALSRLLAYLRATPVIDAISPEIEPVDDLKALRLRRGLSEIHAVKADNLAYFADHKPHGYAFTFGEKK